MSKEVPLDRDYVKDLGDLLKLRESDGWKLVVAKHGKMFAELTEKVLDPKTPVSDAEPMRQARGRLKEEFMPADILEKLISITKKRAEAQTNQALKGSS